MVPFFPETVYVASVNLFSVAVKRSIVLYVAVFI